MSRITSKLQVTIPKSIAAQYRLGPGSEIHFVPAGDVIRIEPAAETASPPPAEERLRLFDQATERQRHRQGQRRRAHAARARGWRRDELYARGVPRRH